ncbi:hypothetical protein EHP00_526 [Ecytonucleospora hepatopenaei]|uniref:Uncharacterized protein n=1 Tax=Ecytonucleospora hepatopenaei TaxID=646526 RepID=A0A1W0E451_9MICR|nr:hypothetical protein EHP00_526 [Ecytonucleospora hepatopenaei]
MRNTPKFCQVCLSQQIILLSGSVYCEKCEVYYQLENGNQFVAAIPVSEIDQMGPDLCKKCEGIKKSNRKIECTSFNDFTKKIKLCGKCKSINHSFLKNLYFRNFVLCRKTKAIYGKAYKFMFFTFALFALITQKNVSNLVTNSLEYTLNSLKDKDLNRVQNFFVNIFQWIFAKIIVLENKIMINNRNVMAKVNDVLREKIHFSQIKAKIMLFSTCLYDNSLFLQNLHKNIIRIFSSLDSLKFFINKKVIVLFSFLKLFFIRHSNSDFVCKTIEAWSAILYSISIRHIMYGWCMWIKTGYSGVFSLFVMTFFAFTKILIMDIYFYVSVFFYICSATQKYSVISENLNRAAEIKEFLSKISFKKENLKNKNYKDISNSTPILIN